MPDPGLVPLMQSRYPVFKINSLKICVGAVSIMFANFISLFYRSLSGYGLTDQNSIMNFGAELSQTIWAATSIALK